MKYAFSLYLWVFVVNWLVISHPARVPGNRVAKLGIWRGFSQLTILDCRS